LSDPTFPSNSKFEIRKFEILRLPTGLYHPRQSACQGVFAEADAAQAELADVGAGPAAQLAAVVLPHAELRGAIGLHYQ
jgi:hypothetical protein